MDAIHGAMQNTACTVQLKSSLDNRAAAMW